MTGVINIFITLGDKERSLGLTVIKRICMISHIEREKFPAILLPTGGEDK